MGPTTPTKLTIHLVTGTSLGIVQPESFDVAGLANLLNNPRNTITVTAEGSTMIVPASMILYFEIHTAPEDAVPAAA